MIVKVLLFPKVFRAGSVIFSHETQRPFGK